MPSPELTKSILALRHPLYAEKADVWRLNELRFSGGDKVFDRLRRFSWEEGEAEAYAARKERAVWMDFPALVRDKLVGSVFAQFPEGEAMDLGRLAAADDGLRAELLQANADGTGSDALQLREFWRESMEAAMPCGFVWIMAEAPEPSEVRRAVQDRFQRMGGIDGESLRDIGVNRPYFVRYSPTQTPYWHFEAGALACLHVELTEQRPRLSDGKITDEAVKVHYLMTRRGFRGWGDDFQAGGWWMVDDDGRELFDDDGNQRSGTWDATGGEIPVARLIYSRSSGGMTNVGRIAEQYMDLLSAMLTDAWESGSGKLFFAGADPEQWRAIAEGAAGGGRYVPVPPKDAMSGAPANVEIVSVAAFDASPAIKSALETLVRLFTQFVLREITTAPDASGEARNLAFAEGNAPRLSAMAAALEDAMNTAHGFLEQRWMGGGEPTCRIRWPRTFDLRSLLDKIRGVIEVMAQVGEVPPTVVAELFVAALREIGLIKEQEDGADPVEAAIRREVGALQRVQIERATLGLEADREAAQAQTGAAARRRQIEEAAAQNGEV